MRNVMTEVKDGKLLITVDLTKDFGPTKSGKTNSVASTEGNQRVGPQAPGCMDSVNVYNYRDAK